MAKDNGRDGAVLKGKKLGCFSGQIHLMEKHHDADADENHRNDGSSLGGIIVVEWNHVARLWDSSSIGDCPRQFGIVRGRSVDLEWYGKSSRMSMASASE